MKTLVFRLVVLCSVILASLITLVSCGQISQTDSEEFSHSRNYDELNELILDSDVIAIGVIDRVIDVKQEMFTRFAFRVEQVLQGEADSEIVLNQTGTADKPGSELAIDPLFQLGDRYLLFLETTHPGIYFSIGPWGRYKITEDSVYSMNRVLQNNSYDAPAKLDFNGTKLVDMIADIASIQETPQLASRNLVLVHPGERATKLDIAFMSGKGGFGQVIPTVQRVDSVDGSAKISMPEGLKVYLVPERFSVSPQKRYESILVIEPSYNLAPGEYWIRIDYVMADINLGFQLTIDVEPMPTLPWQATTSKR